MLITIIVQGNTTICVQTQNIFPGRCIENKWSTVTLSLASVSVMSTTAYIEVVQFGRINDAALFTVSFFPLEKSQTHHKFSIVDPYHNQYLPCDFIFLMACHCEAWKCGANRLPLILLSLISIFFFFFLESSN